MSHDETRLTTRSKADEIALQREQLKLDAAEKGIAAGAALITLALRAGHAYLDAKALDGELQAERARADLELKRLDQAAQHEINKMAVALSETKEATARFKMIMDTIALRGHELPEAAYKVFEKALDSLTRNP